ncbi:hypothetical protein [uncultured Sphingomonas sp.]
MVDQNTQETPVHADADDARAGAAPGVMRYVLGISMLLVIVIFAFLIWGR